jgi:hypothetical protein
MLAADINPDAAAETCRIIRDEGGVAEPCQVDVSKKL